MAETANVEVLISAFTDAAEESLEDVGSKMIDLSFDAAASATAVDDVESELDDATTSAAATGEAFDSVDATGLAGAMEVLANRADEAGDEISQAGRKAATTSGLFSGLTASTNGLSASFGAMSSSLTLSLIPSLLTLSTVLLPLAGILGGLVAAGGSLAAVFGGLAATGVVTHMDELKSALADAKAEILEIIQPLGDVFGPLLLDAVEALPTAVQMIVDNLGPLDQFADTLRRLGAVAMSSIPGLTSLMFDLATQALPAVIDVVQWLQANGAGIVDSVAEAFERLGPPLMAMGAALGPLIADLFDVGMVIGELVIPKMTAMFSLIEGVAERFLSLSDGLQTAAGSAAILAPALVAAQGPLLTIAGAIAGLSNPVLAVIGAIAGLAAAFRTNFVGIRDVVMDVLNSIRPGLNALADNVSGAINQTISIFQDLGDAVQPVLNTVESTLKSNTGKFETFASMAVQAVNWVVTTLRNVFLPAIRFVLMNFVMPLLDGLTQTWSQNFGRILTETINVIQQISGIIQSGLSVMESFWKKHGQTIMAATKFAFDAIIGIVRFTLDLFYTMMTVTLQLIQGDWTEAIGTMADFMVDAFLGLVSFVKEWGIIDAIIGAIADAIQGVKTLVFQTLPAIFIRALATVLTVLENFGSAFRSTMLKIFNGVIGLIVSAINGLVSMVTGAINGILETIDEVADEVSEIPGVSDMDMGEIQAPQIDKQAAKVESGQIVDQQAQEDNIKQVRAVVDVKGDSPLAETIRQQVSANAKKEKRNEGRRKRRNGVSET